ncbi:MAG TPA: NUDIX domain-containing protein [Dehalococcoidales bacterium]
MPVEHSAGAVVFRKEEAQVFYLLLHYEKGHWGSSKGHIEKDETIEETARREIREETGLTDIQFSAGFKETNKYFFVADGQRIFKTAIFLLAETRTKKIKISFEHTGYAWLPYAEAVERMTFKDEKEVLRKADRFILEKRD